MEDLKQSKSDRGKIIYIYKNWRDIKLYSLHFGEKILGASVGAKSDVWSTMPSREQRGYQKSDPGGDHYYVGCLGQTRVSLPE